MITDFDPSVGTFMQLSLSEPATAGVQYSPSDGPWILDLALGENALLYLSRMNVPAITELDLTTGKSRELPYPSTLGPAYHMELGKDGLWMTSLWNIVGLSTAQTGRIDLATGEFTAEGPGTTALGPAPNGTIVGVRASSADTPTPDLVRVSTAGLTPVSVTSGIDRARMVEGLGIRDFMAVDLKTSASWLAGQGSQSITRVDLATGTIRQFQLPVYKGYISSCPYGFDCPSGNLTTAIRGLAVAPNGDVYFSDATLNRIGVIHAGQ